MKTLLLKGIAVFCVLVLASTIMMDTLQTEFGRVDFFEKHGVFFLIFLTFFPRLTLLFSSVTSGGFLWWLGFLICPRILVASLATVGYFQTNPVLVVISWTVALGGEAMEKMGIKGRRQFIFRSFRTDSPAPSSGDPHSHTTISSHDAIEAEFTRKS
jgi:hypothetical protein